MLALDLAPISVRNSLPPMEGLGLSAPRTADISSESRFNYQLDAALQSHANDAGSDNELLIIDAEVHRVDLSVFWNPKPELQVSLRTGLVKNTSGALDGLISNWHATFGLPEGDRGNFRRDAFLITYQQGEVGRALTHSSSGLSDTELALAYQVIQSEKYSLSIHTAVNLPSGREEDLSGSDKADVGFELAMSGAVSESFGWHLNAGALFIGDQSSFGIETQDHALHGSAGLHWQMADQWKWTAQLDGHGAMFVSQIDELKNTIGA